MFRKMRRSQQALSPAACTAILARGSSGVLAVSGDNGYPYAVPLSYVYYNGKVYFHCAKTGHKIDAILRNDKASFCVVDQDQVVPLEYTTYFRSVIVFGTIRVLEDEAAKYASTEALALKYAPEDSPAHRKAAIDREWAPLCVLELTIDHISGKQALELTKRQAYKQHP